MTWSLKRFLAAIAVATPILASILASGAASAGEVCNGIKRMAQTAVAENQLDRLRALYELAVASADCQQDFAQRLGREAAMLFFRRPPEAPPGQDRLRRALALLGDTYNGEKDFDLATAFYYDSPIIMETPEIEGAFEEAALARLLSPDYVSVEVERSAVIVPITFEFDSTRFSTSGRLAAWNMLEKLRKLGSPDIKLIGHTDPVGNDAYNLVLSLERGNAVKRFLRAQSYAGKIAIEGAGEKAPLNLDDPSRYSKNELYRLLRRVEMIRSKKMQKIDP